MMYRYAVVVLLLSALLCCATTSKEALVADMDPLDAGMADGGVMAYFPTRIKQIPLTLSFNPRDNVVCIQFSYQTVTYRQYWDSANRVRFISAVERYHASYEARNLPERKRLKSRKAYDVLKGKTEWGTFKFMVNARSYPQVYLGYIFWDDNPYFLVTQMPAKNEIAVTDEEHNSLQIELYFTRAMAEALAKLFDQDYLVSLVPDHMKNRVESGAPISPDDYSEPFFLPASQSPAAQSPVPEPGTESPGPAAVPEESPLSAR
ncbi:MAG: hypothetical protein LBD78_05770 [Spirochaetaceae bacterium]|nr:hypothetical protein [Spirochaetaceae bacterium]